MEINFIGQIRSGDHFLHLICLFSSQPHQFAESNIQLRHRTDIFTTAKSSKAHYLRVGLWQQ